MTTLHVPLVLCLVLSAAAFGAAPAQAPPAKPKPPVQPLASRPPDITNSGYDYWLSGNAADSKPAKTRAGMFLSGGGGHVMAAWKWFLDCAGHGDIVVLSGSGSDLYQDLVFKSLGGVDSVETINFKGVAAASDSRVLELIAHADGIFMAGGKQTRYVNFWKGSPVGAAINAHVRAGKPLGGTSAGLAVMGQYYYASMNGSVRAEEALRDPFFKMVDIGKDFISVPLLAGVLTDTHFSTRQRLGRLLTFVGRTMADDHQERLVGLGIDEGTALCVEPDGTGRLFTEKNGNAWLVEPTRPPDVIKAGTPLVFRHVKVTGISPESSVNLPRREVVNPLSTRYVSAVDGAVTEEND